MGGERGRLETDGPPGRGHGAGVVLAMIPPTWSQYNTRKADNLEIVPWVFWDSATFTSASTTSLTFFNSVQATLDLGNMTVASMLPSPYAFLLRVPRFFIKASMWTISQTATATTQTSGFNDAALLGNTGVFTLTIGNKSTFQAPLWMVCAGGGAAGPVVDGGATAANLISGYGQVGSPDPRSVLTLWQPLVIVSAINFNVTVTWPAGPVAISFQRRRWPVN